jgi:hypothetical protein
MHRLSAKVGRPIGSLCIRIDREARNEFGRELARRRRHALIPKRLRMLLPQDSQWDSETATAQDPNGFNVVAFFLDYLNPTARDLGHLDWSVERDHSAFCLMEKSNGLQFVCDIFDHNGNLSDIFGKDDDVITER